MATIVRLPQIGVSEESAVLAAWHARVGDAVKAGDILFTLETGKSSFDVEAEVTGTVLAIWCEEGEEKPIKAPLCVVGAPGEAVPEAETAGGPAGPAEPAAPHTPPAASVPREAASGEAAPVKAEDAAYAARGAKVSPRARRLADKAGADAAGARPTGPEGRIIERDVRALIESGEASARPEAEPAAARAPKTGAGYEDRPLTHLRKLIARNMYESLRSTAQLTHNASFDATALFAYRALCKASEEMNAVTLTDMILYAVARTLPEYPELNSHFLDDTLRVFEHVNLACAVDTPRGLLVPVLWEADTLSLRALSRCVKQSAADARAGHIAPEDLTGGSFTVSNLGMFGVESFTPVLNAPQTGILGVCTATERVRTEAGALRSYPAITLSLTYDHRAVDGAPASRFLQALCRNLEQFGLLLGR
ncbi:MAG: 2-oxo acid dehydrogenase subunit E2 [Oscillospiraceae bacterium]|jgi:pyruvate dehydrogenase E2 component (dihydrolipoamide acetyltransferase)|nr:2-oxo acid dehydrogenase subunit E2 [Oscillospiraceae bacterium]